MPTWVLALVVLAALGASAYLFLAETSDDPVTTPEPSSKTTTEQAEGVLSLPDDEEPTDERRRGEEGRDRLDPAAEDTTSDTEADDEPVSPDQRSTYASLRDRTVAILLAASPGTGDAKRLVRVSGLKVPCASPGSETEVGSELALAQATTAELESADASVPDSDETTSFGARRCVDARVAPFADADVAVVYRVVDDADERRVLVGRATGTPDRSSLTLAAELAAALGLDAVTPSTSAATRTLLANAGAIDAPAGASVVLVELPAADVAEQSDRDALAEQVVGAIATHLSRADEQPADTTG